MHGCVQEYSASTAVLSDVHSSGCFHKIYEGGQGPCNLVLSRWNQGWKPISFLKLCCYLIITDDSLPTLGKAWQAWCMQHCRLFSLKLCLSKLFLWLRLGILTVVLLWKASCVALIILHTWVQDKAWAGVLVPVAIIIIGWANYVILASCNHCLVFARYSTCFRSSWRWKHL